MLDYYNSLNGADMLSVLKKFNKLLNIKQKSRLAILGLVTVIGAFLEVIGVSLMLPLITAIMKPDIITTNKYIAYICNILDLHSHRTFVIVCIIVVVFVFIFKDINSCSFAFYRYFTFTADGGILGYGYTGFFRIESIVSYEIDG